MTPPDRVRWTDERLSDRFDAITDEMRAVRDLPQGMARLEVKVEQNQRDTHACHSAMRELRDDFQAYIEEQAQTHEAHRLERKSDRRWMVGTAFTAAGLVIAAMSILIGHI